MQIQINTFLSYPILYKFLSSILVCKMAEEGFLNIQGVLLDSEDSINAPDGFDVALFTWDSLKVSNKLKLSDDCIVCKSTTGSGFKTVLGAQIFVPGSKYYFEIFVHKGQLLKIGVCRPDVNLEQAFCDTVNGWGIYNGELRHNSNSTGQKYGEQIKSGDTIGLALDMIQGTLTYYRNGKSWGIAYKDEELKKGELVAAVSPIYNNDVFSVRTMIKED